MIFMKIKEFSLAMHHGNFFYRISKYNGDWQVSMVTEKKISGMKRTLFIDNVKNIFVLSILQTVSGTSTPIKSYCTF